MAPFLSVCVLTHRRAAFLNEALESVVGQAGSVAGGLEVVVSEDPSDESADTAAVVARHRGALPRLRHTVNAGRLGFDRNFLRAMSLAEGRWCWLLSDDDRFEPGGLARGVAALRADPALAGLTVARVAYDLSLRRRIYQRPLHPREDRTFTEPADMLLSLLDQLGFLSSTVLRRDAFDRAAAREDVEPWVGSGYIQLFLLMQMMCVERRWGYVAEPGVGWRADNDSFNERGLLGRLKMDVEGYARLAGEIFGRGSPTYRAAMAQVARTHARHHIVRAKLSSASWAYTREALRVCGREYGSLPSYWIHTFPLLLLPGGLLRHLRRAVQTARGWLGR